MKSKFVNKIKKYLKNKCKIVLFELILSLALLIVSYIIFKYVKVFPIINAYLIQKGYNELFKGNFRMSFLIVVVFIIVAIAFYISLLFFLFTFIYKEKDYKKGVIKELVDFSKKFFEENKGLLFFILTFSISLSLMYTGILFLITAFPEETLYVKGTSSQSGSNLKCSEVEYLNLIATYEQNCDLFLNFKFNKSILTRAEIRYYINRTEIIETLPEGKFSKEMVTLYFDKVKQPQFLILYFDNLQGEVFTLNTKGVYTKEEYFEREKQKAIWFFTIISFSLFSIFSAMNNVKDIISWK